MVGHFGRGRAVGQLGRGGFGWRRFSFPLQLWTCRIGLIYFVFFVNCNVNIGKFGNNIIDQLCSRC